MRLLVFAALCALAACARQEAIVTCDLSAAREVHFTADDAGDVLSAQTIGPACDKAVGLYTIRTGDGHPVYAWSAPMERAFGGAYQPADEAQAFLDRWAEAHIVRTSDAPEWPLPETASSTLDRLTYEDIRARDLPMLCHLSAVARESCIFWEPGAALASLYLERDIPIAEAAP